MKRKLRFLIALLAVAFISQTAFTQSHGWTLETGLQYSMMVTAKLEDPSNAANPPVTFLDNTAGDIYIGAFVGTECRGIQLVGSDEYIWLSIGSNSVSGEVITFKVYFEADDEEMPLDLYTNGNVLDEEVVFENNGQLGDHGVGNFYIFKVSDDNLTITVNINGVTYGTVTADGDPYENGEDFTVAPGTDVTFVFSPEVGYHVSSILITEGILAPVQVFDADELEANGDFIYLLEDINEDHTVTVVFVVNTYTIRFIAGSNGTLTGMDSTDVNNNFTGVSELWYYADHFTDFDDLFSGTGTRPTGVGNTPVAPAQQYQFKIWSDGEETAIYPDFEVTADITVTALFMPQGWVPLTGLNYTMTVIAKLYIDNELSENGDDLVAAFNEAGACVGLASPDPDNDGLVFLSIGSNDATGLDIRFEIWDSETGEVCDAAHTLEFVSNAVEGNASQPYIIECENEMPLTFVQGYTWFSTNINPGSMELNEGYFEDFTLTPGDRIIGQNQFAVRVDGGVGDDYWAGSLTELDPTKMYRMLFAAVTETETITGSYETFDAFDLVAGYTWVGYLPREAMPINDALVLDPTPAVNDIISRQGAFATFNGTSWIGSLVTLEPGRGYIIKLTNPSTLSYPLDDFSKSTLVDNSFAPADAAGISENFQHQMNVLAKLELNESAYSINPNDVVYAYINGEARGVATPTAHDGLIFLSIGENLEQGDISFKVWIDELEQMVELTEALEFQPMNTIGTLDNPFLFKTAAAAAAQEISMIGKAYPNPFTHATTIPVMLQGAAQIKLSVYNNTGQLVNTIENVVAKGGTHNIVLEKNIMKAGIYHYVVEIHTDKFSQQESGTLLIK